MQTGRIEKPVDVPTRETLEFLTSQVSAGAAILEVGCGEGHLAAKLLISGYRVLGVDSEPHAINQARARQVPAILATWPEFNSSPVDAVVFTRSLHHMEPLTRSVKRARDLLKLNGLFLVEDFAYEEANEQTIRWFKGVIGSRTGKALRRRVAGEFVTELATSSDPLMH